MAELLNLLFTKKHTPAIMSIVQISQYSHLKTESIDDGKYGENQRKKAD